jgi:ribosomal protein S18 acetylase RimI-like enzyme
MAGDGSEAAAAVSIRPGYRAAAMTSLLVRHVRPDEYDALGELTVAAYVRVDPGVLTSDYADELRDVAGRAAGAEVLVAVDEEAGGALVGGVTYVPGPESPSAEFAERDAAGIRMLAVAAAAQRRGVGEALTRACIDRARAASRRTLVLHSTDRMVTAHRLYERLGFERDRSLDWEVEPGLRLRGFRLRLS